MQMQKCKFSEQSALLIILFNQLYCTHINLLWAGQLSRYSDWLRAGWSGDRIPMGVRFSAPLQTGPGAHPASCTMGTGSFPGVKRDRGVTLTPSPPSSAMVKKG